MSIVNVLSNPAVGNLLLVIAAVIGIFGSYGIYLKKKKDKKTALRSALKTELESNEVFDSWIQTADGEDGAPSHLIQPTAAYESNTGNLGLLTDEEVEVITRCYSTAMIMNDVLNWNREVELRTSLKQGVSDRNHQQRIEDITTQLNQLAIKRWVALQTIKKHLGESHAPEQSLKLPESEGEVVPGNHPLIRKFGDSLLENSLIEPVESNSNSYRLTKDGETFFSEQNSDRDFNESGLRKTRFR